jgi:hypothetical protein
MQLHRLAPATQKAYVRAIADLAVFYHRSPDQLTVAEIHRYLHHLLVERHLSWSSCNIVASALRFFYLDTLGWTAFQLNLPRAAGSASCLESSVSKSSSVCSPIPVRSSNVLCS